jgi:hypothetical protein
MNEYYTYAYLREDGTPYYVGKGVRNRIDNPISHRSLPPKDRRIFLKKNLTNEESIRHEIYMIAILGRKDLGTGILRNLTNGGEGVSGRVISEETRQKMIKSHRGTRGWKHTPETSSAISKKNMGRKWYNNGQINKFCYECPKDFVVGMMSMTKEKRRQRD